MAVTYEDATTSFRGNNSNTLDIDMPAVVNADDGVIFIGTTDGDTSSWALSGGPTWTQLGTVVVNAVTLGVFYAQCAGTEDGATVTWTWSGNQKAACQIHRMSGDIDFSTVAPEWGTATFSSSTSADPPALAPSGGNGVQWFAGFAFRNGADSDITTDVNTTFSNRLDTEATGTGRSSLFTYRANTDSASQNPSAATLAEALSGVAFTIGVVESGGSPLDVTVGHASVTETAHTLTIDAAGSADVSVQHANETDAAHSLSIAAAGSTDLTIGHAAVTETAHTVELTLPTDIVLAHAGGTDNYLANQEAELHYAGTPDPGPFSDLDVRVKLRFRDFTDPDHNSFPFVVSQYKSSGEIGNRTFYFRILGTTSVLRLLWYEDDGTTFRIADSTAGYSFNVGDIGYVRAALDTDDGSTNYTVTFYTSTDGINWTQLGSVITGAGLAHPNVAASTLPVAVAIDDTSSDDSGDLVDIFEAWGYSDLSESTEVFHFDANDFNIGDGDTDTANDHLGNTWTIFGADNFIEGARSETDTAYPVTVQGAGSADIDLAHATETDTAYPVALTFGAGDIDLAHASETDVAHTVTIPPPDVNLVIEHAAETDTAHTLSIEPAGSADLILAHADETNSAHALEIQGAGSTDLAIEHAGGFTQFLDNAASAGHNVSTSDPGTWTDFDVIVKMRMADWTPASEQAIISQWSDNATAQQGWSLSIRDGLDGAPRIRYKWTLDGDTGGGSISLSPGTIANDAIRWIRVKHNVGTWANILTSEDGITFTSHGLGGGTASRHDSTADVRVADDDDVYGPADIDVFEAWAYSDLTETTKIFHFNADDFENGDSNGDTAVGDAGNTWTINGVSNTIDSDAVLFSEEDQAHTLEIQAAGSIEIALEHADETDTAFGLTIDPAGSADLDVAHADETDDAHPLTVEAAGSADLAIEHAGETDVAYPVQLQTAIELAIEHASETDSAHALSIEPAGAANITVEHASETDDAYPISIEGAGSADLGIEHAGETDIAYPILLQTAIELVVEHTDETDVAHILAIEAAGSANVDLEHAGETDNAHVLSIDASGSADLVIAHADETDVAHPLTLEAGGASEIVLAHAAETNTAFIVDLLAVGAAPIDLAHATETDDAHIITLATGAEVIQLGHADETNSAFTVSLGSAALLQIEHADETDTAYPITLEAAGTADLAIAHTGETDTAFILSLEAAGSADVSMGHASEADLAYPVTLEAAGSADIDLGHAGEIDDAFPVSLTASGAANLSLAHAAEIDVAYPVLFQNVGPGDIVCEHADETDTAHPCSLVVAVGPDGKYAKCCCNFHKFYAYCALHSS